MRLTVAEVAEIRYSRIEDSIRTAKKSVITSPFSEPLLGNDSKLTPYERGMVADLCNNFDRICDSNEGGYDSLITRSNYGPYIPNIIGIIAAWYPTFPLKDLISVQTMNTDLGYIIATEYRTGSTKAPTLAGEIISTPQGPRVIRGTYPTGEVVGEDIVQAQIQFDSVADVSNAVTFYYPLNTSISYQGKYMLTVTSTNPTVAGVYHSKVYTAESVLLENTAGNTATIYVQTGQISVKEPTTAATVTRIVANYVWAIETAVKETIPSIEEEMVRHIMQAEPRALAFTWSIFAEFSKTAQYGMDLRTDSQAHVMDLMYQYQTRYILDEMRDYAKGTPFSMPPIPATGDLDSKIQFMLDKLGDPSSQIAANTGRMEGNKIVTGSRFKNWLQSLPSTWYTPAGTDPNLDIESPRELGRFGKYQIFYDPLLNRDAAWMTYKASNWWDATYYLAEFMPIMPSDAIRQGVRVQSVLASMDAYRYDKPAGVVPISFTGF